MHTQGKSFLQFHIKKKKTPSRRDSHGTIKGSARWHVLLIRKSLGVRTDHEEASSKEEMSGIFMCLQSSERAHMKRRSQFGRGAGVGGERGGWGGGIRRGESR